MHESNTGAGQARHTARHSGQRLIAKLILRSSPPQSPPGRSRPIRDIQPQAVPSDCRNRVALLSVARSELTPKGLLVLVRSEHTTNCFPEALGPQRILAVPTEWAQTARLLPVGALNQYPRFMLLYSWHGSCFVWISTPYQPKEGRHEKHVDKA